MVAIPKLITELIAGLRVGVVIPAFNEEQSLRRLIPAIPRDLVDEVVVSNDGSTDGTSAAAREAGAFVIDRPVRGGPGPAIRDGLLHLRAQGTQIVAVMASSGKHDPAELPRLIEPLALEGLDLDEQMLAQARRRLPDVVFHHADMVAFDLPSAFEPLLDVAPGGAATTRVSDRA